MSLSRGFCAQILMAVLLSVREPGTFPGRGFLFGADGAYALEDRAGTRSFAFLEADEGMRVAREHHRTRSRGW